MSCSTGEKLVTLGDRSERNACKPVVETAHQPLQNSVPYAGNVSMVTLGCAKNLVDSEVMLGALLKRGFRAVKDPQNAELIVVNTCAFLQSAVEEGLDTILELSRLKQTGRCRKLIVAGCMVERYRQDLEQSLPEVDRFISTDELLSVGDDTTTTTECFDESRRPYFLYDETAPRVRGTEKYTAYVKIAEGCDRPCSFCIIPKIRGRFRSREENSIVAEIENLIDDGAKEINFVAQDLTAYGADRLESKAGIKLESGLLKLLRKIENRLDSRRLEHDVWLRLLYAYPIGVTDELIRHIADSKYVCNYLDMPLQHVSNPVLKAMNRPLGEKGTRGLIEKIRALAPQVALRTTFIVGFPGETEQDILSLENFIREGHFAHVGIFTYSQEAEAKSFPFPNQIEQQERDRRREFLMAVQQEVLKQRHEQLLGTRFKVLLEGAHSESDLLLVGRANWQAPETDGEIIINDFTDGLESIAGASTENLRGRFAEVELTEVAGYDLVGKLVAIDQPSYDTGSTVTSVLTELAMKHAS